MQFLGKWQVRRLDKVSDASDVIYNRGEKTILNTELEKNNKCRSKGLLLFAGRLQGSEMTFMAGKVCRQ